MSDASAPLPVVAYLTDFREKKWQIPLTKEHAKLSEYVTMMLDMEEEGETVVPNIPVLVGKRDTPTESKRALEALEMLPQLAQMIKEINDPEDKVYDNPKIGDKVKELKSLYAKWSRLSKSEVYHWLAPDIDMTRIVKRFEREECAAGAICVGKRRVLKTGDAMLFKAVEDRCLPVAKWLLNKHSFLPWKYHDRRDLLRGLVEEKNTEMLRLIYSNVPDNETMWFRGATWYGGFYRGGDYEARELINADAEYCEFLVKVCGFTGCRTEGLDRKVTHFLPELMKQVNERGIEGDLINRLKLWFNLGILTAEYFLRTQTGMKITRRVIHEGKMEFLEKLLAIAPPTEGDINRLFQEACASNQRDFADYFLTIGASIKSDSFKCVINAITNGHSDMFKWLFRKLIETDMTDHECRRCICILANHGKYDWISPFMNVKGLVDEPETPTEDDDLIDALKELVEELIDE